MPRTETGTEVAPTISTSPPSKARALHAWWLVPLALAAALSLARGATNAVRADWGSTDFHAYWLAGHFLRANRDPYAAFLFARRPAVPVRYLDGTVETDSVIRPGLGNLPANTAPMTLLLAPLAWWSWPWARMLWLVLNLALALAIPSLAIGLLPSRPPPWARWAIAFTFWALVATRVAIGTGQTTLLALAAMLAALCLIWGKDGLRAAPPAVQDNSPWSGRTLFAGLLLGLAVSKYSLALPAVLLLSWRRRWRVLAIAAAVQLLAYGWMALLPGGGWKETLNAYLILLQMHLPQEGIHVAAALGGGAGIGLVAAGLLSTVTVVSLVWRGRLASKRGATVDPVAEAHRDVLLLAVLSLWTLLVAYHRIYDVTLVVTLLAAMFAAFARPAAWGLTDDDRTVVMIFLAPGVLLLALGGEGLFGMALPGEMATQAAHFARMTTTRTLLGAWVIALWLYGRVARFEVE